MGEAFSFNRPAHERAATRFMGDLFAAMRHAAGSRIASDIADAAGLTPETVKAILQGKANPTAREIGALAHALGLEITIKVKVDAE